MGGIVPTHAGVNRGGDVKPRVPGFYAVYSRIADEGRRLYWCGPYGSIRIARAIHPPDPTRMRTWSIRHVQAYTGEESVVYTAADARAGDAAGDGGGVT